MMSYQFYGWEKADIEPINSEFKNVGNPRHLYDLLSNIWCADTCAPRMRDEWTENNKTLGQCSITAFLAQDIYGGKVLGIPRPDGNFHCYNVVGNCVFDLTSEQFGDEVLDYTSHPEQLREVHFSKEEKRSRYLLLKERLLETITKTDSNKIDSKDSTQTKLKRPIYNPLCLGAAIIFAIPIIVLNLTEFGYILEIIIPGKALLILIDFYILGNFKFSPKKNASVWVRIGVSLIILLLVGYIIQFIITVIAIFQAASALRTLFEFMGGVQGCSG